MGEEVPARTLEVADPTSPIPSHCASIVVTSTLRVNTACQDYCAEDVWPVTPIIHSSAGL